MRTFATVVGSMLLHVASAQDQSPCEVFRLENPLAPLDGHFGAAVSLGGDRLLVGMPSQSTSPSFGSAYVYQRNAAGWSLIADLPNPEPESSDRFGWAVALEDDVALVTKREDGALGAKGAVFVFQRQPTGEWVSTQKLTPDAHPEAWAFGWSMELEGTRAVIAAKGAGSVGPKGRVFVYELEDGLFVEKAKLAPSLDNLSDWFGASVALDGDRIAVGAPKGGGRAYVFDRQPSGEWLEQSLLVPSDIQSADEYGYAVALRGDRVAVSAPGHDVPYWNGGAVYVFERGADGWLLADKLASPPWGSLARFGWSLDLTDDTLMVGAPTNASVMTSAGCLHVFQLVDDAWIEGPKVFGSDPGESAWFGSCLDRDGDDVAVGAPAATGPFVGRVHMFSFEGGAHLGGESASLHLAGGGEQALQLGACPEHAGDFYLLLGTGSGTAPPVPLGDALLPLVPDGYLGYTLATPNSAVLQGSLGVLDPWGRGTAAFTLPAGADPALAGLLLHHAYVVLDGTTLAVELASNAVPLRLIP